jgi:hypothetical protein
VEAIVYLLATLAVLGLFAFGILKLVVKLSSWEKLVEAYPAPADKLPKGETTYRGCYGRIDRITFSSRGRGVTIKILAQGLGVHIGLPMMPDFVVPWNKIEKVQEISMFGRSAATISIQDPLRLELEVPKAALSHLRGFLAESVFKEPRKIESMDDLMELRDERKKK